MRISDWSSDVCSSDLLDAVYAYTRIYWNNAPTLKLRFKIDELNKVTSQSFGLALAEVDLDISDAQLHSVVSERVDELLAEQIAGHNRLIDLPLGCHLINGDAPYPIHVIGTAWCRGRLLKKWT